MSTRKRRNEPENEYNFWQPATDMMSGLVFVLILIIALLGLYLLSDYTGYEEAPSSSEEAASSHVDDDDHGSWYHDDLHGTGDGNGDGSGDGKYDQQIIQSGGGGGYGEDGIKTAVFVELIDDETERRIQEQGVRFELYRTDTTHLQNGTLQTLNTYYPEKINYREYETTEEGVFYLPEKIWQGSYYFHELTEPEGYDAAADTYYDVDRMYDWPDPYVVQIRVAPCKNIIRIQMNDAETEEPVGGGTFRVMAGYHHKGRHPALLCRPAGGRDHLRRHRLRREQGAVSGQLHRAAAFGPELLHHHAGKSGCDGGKEEWRAAGTA